MQYRTLLATRENLPAFKSKEEFLKMLHKSRIVLVVGETGVLGTALAFL